jgi:hypothetical protein
MYPVTFEAGYPGSDRNRLTTFFRGIIAIPWFIVAGLYGIGTFFAAIAAWFTIVFTGRYPDGLYDFVAKFVRLSGRVTAFYDLITDEYPPFNGDPDNSYPVRIGIPPPQAEYDRVKTGLRFIVGIPVMLLAWVQGLIAAVIALIGWFSILFTGNLSEGLFKPLRSASAYGTRANAYLLLLTEDWPPFELEETAGTPQQLPGSETPPAAPSTPAPGAGEGREPGTSA